MPLVLRVVNTKKLPDGYRNLAVIEGHETFKIGRSASVDWHLPDETSYISANHCEIKSRDGEIFELDDVSTNGTFLEGRDLRLTSPHKISEGDRFRIGPYIIQANFVRSQEAKKFRDQYLSNREFSISFKLVSLGKNGNDALTNLVFAEKTRITIGRDPDCDICVDDSTRRTSRLHCEILFDQGRFALVDRSKNGVTLNKLPLMPSEKNYLAVKDQIEINTNILIVTGIKGFSRNTGKPENPVQAPFQTRPESGSDFNVQRAGLSKRGLDPAESIAADGAQRTSKQGESERTSRPLPDATGLEDEIEMTRITSPFRRSNLDQKRD